MLRRCPIPRFSSARSSKKNKMPKSLSKEKAPQAPLESQVLELLEPKEVTREPSQKVLKIFSINIITQSLPFCRSRVSGFESGQWGGKDTMAAILFVKYSVTDKHPFLNGLSVMRCVLKCNLMLDCTWCCTYMDSMLNYFFVSDITDYLW